jgi:hypothetical protein
MEAHDELVEVQVRADPAAEQEEPAFAGQWRARPVHRGERGRRPLRPHRRLGAGVERERRPEDRAFIPEHRQVGPPMPLQAEGQQEILPVVPRAAHVAHGQIPPAPVAPVPRWDELETYQRLVGYLRGLLFAVERNNKTANGLVQKAMGFLHKNAEKTFTDREDLLSDMAARAAIQVLEPSGREIELMELYGSSRMDGIAAVNAAATRMVDIRQRLGFGWRVLAGVGAIAATALAAGARPTSLATPHPRVAVGMLAAGAAMQGALHLYSKGPAVSAFLRRAFATPSRPVPGDAGVSITA